MTARVLLAVGLGGCAAPAPGYDEVRLDCGLAAGDFVPLPYHGGGPLQTIDAACAASLGDLLALDWASFGAEPADVDWPYTPADALIGAAYTLLAADVGTVGELEAAASADEVTMRVLAEGDWPVEGPAGEPWVEHLAAVVDRTYWSDDVAGEAAFVAGALEVDFVPRDDGSLTLDEHPVYLASVLVHEASHSYGGHVDCTSGGDVCDADGNGAYGAQIRLLTSWSTANADLVDDDDLFDVSARISLACHMIVDPGSIPECAESEH